ncbi:MAG: DUF4065 domain-containing protein [Holosporales bacterium]|jgi:uncharacterized phage-associated protein|nr:DUF4065 domain-containing protein [Holosporales bacterium]
MSSLGVFDVANYFLALTKSNEFDVRDGEEGISNLKLQKLCYYAQGFWLALKGECLFNEDIEAWQHGPAIFKLYEKYKEYKSNPIPASSDFDIDSIPKEIASFLNEIYQEYGQYSAWKLRAMTHRESPWLNAMERIRENPMPEDTKDLEAVYKGMESRIVSDQDMAKFFKTKIRS